MQMTNEQIAHVAWEAHAALLRTTGDVEPESDDSTFDTFEELEPEHQQSLIDGVRFVRGAPNATPAEVHENWLRYKLDHGWQYGEEFDEIEKTHPRLVGYGQLPDVYRKAAVLFLAVVRAGAKG